MGAGPASDQDTAANGVFSMAPAMADAWPADAFTLTGTQVAFSSGVTYRDKLRVYPTLPARTNSLTYTTTYHFTVRNTTSGATAVYPVQNIASGTQVKYTGTFPGTISQISAPTVSASLVKTATSLVGPPYHVTYRVVVSNSSTSPVTLDSLRDSPTPTGSSNWTFDTGTAKLNGSAIADPVLDSGRLFFNGPFSVPGSGALTFTYTLAIFTTVANAAVGTIGDVELGATPGTGNEVSVDPSAPIVTTASLADATAGTSYSQTLTASGGTGSYTWSLSSGSLPSGLALNSSTGVISGTPSAAGASAFTVSATDATPKSGTKSLTLTVAAGGGGGGGDTTAPTGSVSVNAGAATTTSTTLSVGLSATDAVGVTAYRITSGSDCSSASWTAVTTTTSLSTTVSLAVAAGDGTKTVCAQFKDAAGNVSTTSTDTIVLDATAPTVALSSAAASTVTGSFAVTATFSEAVTGFVAADLTIANGTVSAFSGSGTTYTFTVSPTADGTVTIDVPAAAAADAAGNASVAASQLIRIADVTRPSLTLTSAASATTSTAFSVTATFSESVTGFDASDVTVGNGTVSSFAGSGTTYTFTITPGTAGSVTVDASANSAADAAGNGNTQAPQLTRTYSASAPTIVLTTATSTANGAFTVTAVFSAAVTGFDLADVTVGNGSASAISGTGASDSFTVTPAAEGAVTVDLGAGGAHDAAGNGNAAATRLQVVNDSTLPTVATTTGPTGSTTDATAIFAFAADEATTFTCSLDGAAFSTCSSPTVVTGIGAGAHVFMIRATDVAGNTAVTTRAWTVALPAVTFSVTPEDPSDDTVTLAWSSTGSPLTFTCTLDGAAGTACASPLTLTNLIDGPHIFTVEAHVGTALTGSAAIRWTSQKRVPKPNVLIIPKISATDMLGRPQPFKQSLDAPHSLGPFTRKLQVKLHIPTPVADDLQEVDYVYISNFSDFRNTQRFPVAADEQYDWELLAGPSGDRPVYIRYADTPDAPVGAATIVLDQELPTLAPKPMATRTAARSVAVQRRAATYGTIYCGAAPRRWLQLPATDGFSGLNAVQIASDRAHPCKWRPYLPTLSYRLPGKAVWIRIEDRVGNISSWYRVRTK
jgi:hypothetical protein